MKVSEAKYARVRAPGFRAIAWVLLLAFTLQSFITQTHIHGAYGGGTSAAAVTNTSNHKTVPADNGKAECPFCQAIVHAGTFSAPAAQTIGLSLSWAETAPSFLVVEAFVSVTSHLWRSRAPPRR